MPISSVVAETIAQQQSADDQEVVEYINNVVTPNSTVIDAPSPAAGSEVMNLIDSLAERIMYGELTAQEASEEFITEATSILGA